MELANSDSGKDVIQFAPDLADDTIELELGPLQITSDLELLGMGVTINAVNNSGVLVVTDKVDAATIRDLTITGGSALLGGGILNSGKLDVIDSTISGNSADIGGGIYNRAGGILSLSVVNSTIAGNTTDANNDGTGSGGGVRTSGVGPTTLHNTIVAGNVKGIADPDEPPPDDLSGDVETDSSYNLIGDLSTSGGLNHREDGNIVGVSDLSWLLELGDYGGTTQTHALSPESPAVDAGNPFFDLTAFDPPLVTDQRGNVRTVDGNSDEVAIIDIGAFEYKFTPATTLYWDGLGAGMLSLADTATLGVAGAVAFENGTEYQCALGSSTNGLMETVSNIELDGTLQLYATDDPADGPRQIGSYTRTLVAVAGSVQGTFAQEPAVGGHLGYGVFYQGITYGADAVNVNLFQAAAGDANGDRRVDNADLQLVLAAGFFGTGQYGAVAANSRLAVPQPSDNSASVHSQSAADAVLKQAVERGLTSPETSLNDMAWLHEVGQIIAGEQPSTKDSLVKEAVDTLLAT